VAAVAHAMHAVTRAAQRVHAMSAHETGSEAGPVTHAVAATDLTRVAAANVRSALAMGSRIFAMSRVSVVCMRHRMA